MEIEELLKMFKPAAYIPAKDTKDGKKLYILKYDNSIDRDTLMKAMPTIRKYFDNCICIPDPGLDIMSKKELNKLLEGYLKCSTQETK